MKAKFTAIRKITPWLLAVPFLANAQKNDSTAVDCKTGSKYMVEVKLPPRAIHDGLAAIAISEHIFLHSKSDFVDLRIFSPDRNDEVVPYVIRPVRELRQKKIRTRGKIKIIDNDINNDENTVSVLLEILPESEPIASLDIVIPYKDYQSTVKIFHKSTPTGNETLMTEGMVYDHSQILGIRSNTIELPTPAVGFLRVEFKNTTAENESDLYKLKRILRDGEEQQREESKTIHRRRLRVNSIAAWSVAFKNYPETVKTNYPITIDSIRQDKEKQQTIANLSNAKQPIDKIFIDSQTQNYRRAVSLYKPTDSNSWQRIGRGYIHNYHIGELNETESELSINETRASNYRLVIADGDAPPLSGLSIRAEGQKYEIVIPSDRGEKLAIYYGADGQTRPNYDFAQVVEKIGITQKLETVALPETTANSNYINPEFVGEKKQLQFPRILLWLLIAIITALLLLLLWKNLHGINSLPDDDN